MHEGLDVSVEIETTRHGRLGLAPDVRQVEQTVAGDRRFELVREHSCHRLGDNGILRVGGVLIRTESVVRGGRVELRRSKARFAANPKSASGASVISLMLLLFTEAAHHPLLAASNPSPGPPSISRAKNWVTNTSLPTTMTP